MKKDSGLVPHLGQKMSTSSYGGITSESTSESTSTSTSA